MENKQWESLMETIPEDIEGSQIFQNADWNNFNDQLKADQENEIELAKEEGLQSGLVLIPRINEDKMKAFLENNIRIDDVPDYRLDIEKITYNEETLLYTVDLKDGGRFTTAPEVNIAENDFDYDTYRVYFTQIPEYLQAHGKQEADDLHIRFDAKDVEIRENFTYFQVVDRNFTQEPSEKLENKTVNNMTNESLIEAQAHLKKEIDRLEPSTLTKQDVQELLSNHLENVERILAGYEDAKKQGTPWKERFNSFKDNLKQSFERFKESVKEKVQAIKQAPVNLKNKAKNKVIDGIVSVNNKIIDKTNNLTRKMEEKRPENSQKRNGQQLIDDYKTEYKKHLINNFVGNEFQNEVNKILINDLDSQLTNKPHLALQLRHQAIAELHQEVLESDSKNFNVDINKFNSYLEDKSELLMHGLNHFEDFQKKELLKEDLKFGVYREPEKGLEQSNGKKFDEKEQPSSLTLNEIEANNLLKTYFENLEPEVKNQYEFHSSHLNQETNTLTFNYEDINDRAYSFKRLELNLQNGEGKEINEAPEDKNGMWVKKESVVNEFDANSIQKSEENENNFTSKEKVENLLHNYFENLEPEVKNKYEFQNSHLNQETNVLTLKYNNVNDQGYSFKRLELNLETGQGKEINERPEDKNGLWVKTEAVINEFDIKSLENHKGNEKESHEQEDIEMEI
ncbi:hypothetical protein P8822_00170 [Bacillus sonorensis]|uniref:hypothetical protein n=1 Tax=Bacillus subtilis group TaxID=653685 RepID=UPI001FD64763|nr:MULTISPECIES: hypothetical protein [Bacillus subtilis group]MCJ8223708.1 hypothetical protein [Bacillus paralicheniformis]MEC0526229.1 hypothetical protein [Bacillus sonorensis]